MAEDKTNVYDSTGDKPTNWQEFEDADTSSASSTDVSDDELTKLENTFMSIVGNDTIVASLCSTVGAVLYQSWKEKTHGRNTRKAKKEKRYFSLQRITENLFLSAKQSVNVPQNLQKEPRKQVL